MEILDFLFGVILTIVGVVTVETIIEYYKDKKQMMKLIISLGFEISGNIDVARFNLKNLEKKEKNNHLLFGTDSYSLFKLSITQKIILLMGKDSISFLHVGYMFCNEFNRRFTSNPKQLAGFDEKECFELIKYNFEKVLDIIWKIKG